MRPVRPPGGALVCVSVCVRCEESNLFLTQILCFDDINGSRGNCAADSASSDGQSPSEQCSRLKGFAVNSPQTVNATKAINHQPGPPAVAVSHISPTRNTQ